ncbi:MAG: tRNA uridine-5-carboxymethylaminomethyl(34) synthesis enzyme MnmG [Ruminococcaceae bacterium]|nr:tRNA uridine-5-carboxymethylaminomethyl(34) synthesis enzyme MnmG [Oscillospiraceae bacterium]
MNYIAGNADIAVIGAGHAGIEAALAAARLGMKTLLFTINLDAVGNMPCNPSIGGTGKGHLVYEIDALGGEMGYAADLVTLQTRTLNLGKGPAVHSKRVQADRIKYREIMKKTLENTPNLSLIQAEIVDFETEEKDEKKQITSVITKMGAVWKVKCAVVCAGTFLNGRVITGECAYESGPDGMLPAKGFTNALLREGIEIYRFKTGTPPRVHEDTVDMSVLEIQNGDLNTLPFSSRTDSEAYKNIEQIPCRIVYTSKETHDIIRSNLDRSPLYSGEIKGTGPRYCPSIEDKVVRFADKERHQLFVEPCGKDTKELYIQGFSSSLPEEVQIKMLHSLKGFENAQMMRTAYAIEYDCINPTQLYPTLEFKSISGLYGAGQFNGTSGYEEAAAQGLIAGINAALKIKGQEPLILTRDSSYIGTLIDDIVTKGTNEPYRMMTSRSEYRLLLRQDNADTRLTTTGYRLGLISEERYNRYLDKQKAIEAEVERANRTTISPSEALNKILEENGTTPITTGVKLADLLRRPQINYNVLTAVDTKRPELPLEIISCAEVIVKYDGYIKRQLSEVAKFAKTEAIKLPADLDYDTLKGLRIEARQKLNKIKPENIGQASRISGVSPADITVLLIYCQQNKRNNGENTK